MTRHLLPFLLAGTAASVVAAPSPPPKGNPCTKWESGVCLSMHRIKGAVAPYAVGYVFGPKYGYTALADIPPPVVTYYKLGPDKRYVYEDGYLYEVDPATSSVIQVIDTDSH